MPGLPLPDPLDTKVLLALTGALFGWGVRAIWEELQLRLRWRRLAPLVLRQLVDTASQCGQAFDTAALPRIDRKLAAAHASAVELVAAGVRVRQWLEGLLHLSNAIDALQAAEAAPAMRKGEAMETFRERGHALRLWASRM